MRHAGLENRGKAMLGLEGIFLSAAVRECFAGMHGQRRIPAGVEQDRVGTQVGGGGGGGARAGTSRSRPKTSLVIYSSLTNPSILLCPLYLTVIDR